MKLLSYLLIAGLVAATIYLFVALFILDVWLLVSVVYILFFILILYGAANFGGGDRSGKLRR